MAHHILLEDGADGLLEPMADVADLEEPGPAGHEYAHKGQQDQRGPAPDKVIEEAVDGLNSLERPIHGAGLKPLLGRQRQRGQVIDDFGHGNPLFSQKYSTAVYNKSAENARKNGLFSFCETNFPKSPQLSGAWRRKIVRKRK